MNVHEFTLYGYNMPCAHEHEHGEMLNTLTPGSSEVLLGRRGADGAGPETRRLSPARRRSILWRCGSCSFCVGTWLYVTTVWPCCERYRSVSSLQWYIGEMSDMCVVSRHVSCHVTCHVMSRVMSRHVCSVTCHVHSVTCFMLVIVNCFVGL